MKGRFLFVRGRMLGNINLNIFIVRQNKTGKKVVNVLFYPILSLPCDDLKIGSPNSSR